MGMAEVGGIGKGDAIAERGRGVRLASKAMAMPGVQAARSYFHARTQQKTAARTESKKFSLSLRPPKLPECP